MAVNRRSWLAVIFLASLLVGSASLPAMAGNLKTGVTWSAISKNTPWRLPFPVYRTVATALRGNLYVLGGIDPAGQTIANVERIDPADGSVRPYGALAEPTHGAAVVAVAGNAVVYGGASTAVHTIVQLFDPATAKTTVIANLPAARADLAAAIVGDRTVLLGGFDGYGPLSSVLIGTPRSGFRALTELPVAVRYPGVVSVGTDVLLFGGLLSGGEYTGTFSSVIQEVNVGTHSARIVGHLPYAVAHAKAAVVGGQVLVVGGSTPSGPTSDILDFDVGRGTTSLIGHLPESLTDGALAVLDGVAYFTGGIMTSGPSDRVVSIRLRRPAT